MDDLSMAEGDLVRILAALAARTVRVTIDTLPAAASSTDWEQAELLASHRQARHDLGVRGVWVHDAKDYNSTHFLEALGADPDQQRVLIAAGAIWVGPRHLAPT